MVNKIRRLLINLGKVLPFILCFVLLIGYTESIISLVFDNYLNYENYLTLSTPLSFWIALKFQYDYLTLFIITIISFAIETCKWNKLAILYLLMQLWEKDYFFTIELYKEYIYLICIINIIVCTFFVLKGITIFLKNFKIFGT